ncbi:hypothetical protein PSACC_03008 [Paramicrosporidium saccamoebae]|uniref:Arrestin C-terminal-like domain-containing protein n=1 Tax=Paramicrosporidium saccamoebae TaxID=1246581 RepID=A0A2H9THG7_9FUNG|nr:hypothetical protein PSACC_03008 [Paramicrosporidium saccamoebae]
MTFLGRLFGQSNIIHIHTDKQQYYAGDLVTGQVTLSVVQPLHVDGVYLKINGNELTEFDVTRSRTVKDPHDPQKNIVETYTERVNGHHTFFRRRYCIYATKSTLSSGNFVFPFQFQLDQKLPGTFEIYNKRQYSRSLQASLRYHVEAEVAVPGMLKPNLYHSQDILINEPLRNMLMSSDTLKEAKVTFLCCIPKGTVTMSANIDKNAYSPGETVQLHLIVDNSESQVDLEAFTLKLRKDLSVHAGSDTFYGNGTVIKASSPGVRAGDRADRYIQLSLPHDTEPSTRSKLIECEYELNVVLKVPWSPDVVTKQAVQIVAAQRQDYVSKLQYPSGWEPSVMPMSDLQSMSYISY